MATIFNNTEGRAPQLQEFGRFGNMGDALSKFQGFKGFKGRNRFIQGASAPGILEEISAFNRFAGQRAGAQQNLFDVLDPRNNASILQNFARGQLGQAQGIGRRRGNLLRSRFGNQPGLRAAGELSASNDANRAIGNFNQQLNNPLALASRFQGQIGALDPLLTLAGSGFTSGLQSRGGGGQKQPGFLDTLLGIGGSLGGFL